MVSMHVLVDGSSLWRQRLQHIDITLLSYNAVRHHGTQLPRYKEGRLTASVGEWLRAWDTLTMFEATVCGRS